MVSEVASAVLRIVLERAQAIGDMIERYVDSQGVQLLHVRNLMSLPYNLPASIALHDLALRRPDLAFLLQHHDLYWEGPNARSFITPYEAVQAQLDRVMVPPLPNATHVLINPIAADALRHRTGIDGTVVPDGFDFDRALPEIDDISFRRRLRVLTGDTATVMRNDLVVAMPARIAINKAIELAVQFTAALETQRSELENATEGLGPLRRQFDASRRIVLLLPQGEDLEDNRVYLDRVLDYARHLGVTVVYGGDIVVPDRRLQLGDTQHVPFYGTYGSMDIVCYPPEHEGFGNQAIEAVWARRSLVVLEYPVFKRFVAAHIPHVISLGDTAELRRLDGFGGLHEVAPDRMTHAALAAVAVLLDHPREQQQLEDNFRSLRGFCGIDVVASTYEGLYAALLQRVGQQVQRNSSASTAGRPDAQKRRPAGTGGPSGRRD
ncbi:MAG: hypothetical protein JOY68_05620 [Candidatus Dormibacteraeota bacterium]|nr:hypothetical protein [Candidatus Dormibacteraeota bacterium]